MLQYLKDTLGLNAMEREWHGAEKLPLYLRSGRRYSVLSVDGSEHLLICMETSSFNLSAFQKQQKKLMDHWRGEIVLCFEALSAYQRKALIEKRISFIVPGSQVYLPYMGVVLQERNSSKRKTASKLAASSQFLLLCLLYGKENTPLNKVELSKRLNVSAMNITRAVQELEALGLAKVQRSGRSDYVTPVAFGKELYDKAKPYLISPVQQRLFVKENSVIRNLPLSGETALAERTILNPPAVVCKAIGRKDFKDETAWEQIDPAWYSGTDYIELEIWKYDPAQFAQGGLVDAISLAAALAAHGDERIELAVEELMEGYQW